MKIEKALLVAITPKTYKNMQSDWVWYRWDGGDNYSKVTNDIFMKKIKGLGKLFLKLCREGRMFVNRQSPGLPVTTKMK